MENNQGPANIGQAKWMAKRALAIISSVDQPLATAIEQRLTQPQPNPAGATLPALPAILDFSVPNPLPAGWAASQRAPLLLGQLKAIAAPFYEQINGINPATAAWLANEKALNQTETNDGIFPWTNDAADDRNKSIATIGQLKACFSLRFTESTQAMIGVPTFTEAVKNLPPGSTGPNADPDGDGLTNAEEATLGTRPDLADTDDDDVPDNKDAVPTDTAIWWQKTPVPRYALVETDIPTMPIDGMYHTITDINRSGEILFAPLSWPEPYAASIWSPVTQQIRDATPPSMFYGYLGTDPWSMGIGDDGSHHVSNGTHHAWAPNAMYQTPGGEWTEHVPGNWITPPPESDPIGWNHVTNVAGEWALTFSVRPAGVGEVQYEYAKYHLENSGWTSSQPVTLSSPWGQTAPKLINRHGHVLFRDRILRPDESILPVSADNASGFGSVTVPIEGTVYSRNIDVVPGYGSSMWVESPEGDAMVASACPILPDNGDFAENGIGLLGNGIWLNGRSQALAPLVAATGWSDFQAGAISTNGLIAATAVRDTTGQREIVLLAPVEVKDIRNDGDADDQIISGMKKVPTQQQGESLQAFWTRRNTYFQQKVADSSIAYIDPHRGFQNSPDMPRLVASIPAHPAGIRVKWRVEVEYLRGNGYRADYVQDFSRAEDKVNLPLPTNFVSTEPFYTEEMAGNQDWRIFESADWQAEIAQRGFFGGTAKVYLWITSSSETPPTEPFITFRIGGKNPDPAMAKTYIQTHLCDNRLWFAYAIAKKESPGYDKPFYNQFFGSTRKSSPVDRNGNPVFASGFDENKDWQCWAKGWPVYNIDRASRSGPMTSAGGYGIFQVTGDAQDQWTAIPRSQIWNWQDNIGYQKNNVWYGAMGILKAKIQFVDARYNSIRQTYSNCGEIPHYPLTSTSTIKRFSGWDAYTCKGYNGFGGTQPKILINGFGKARQWSTWHPTGSHWSFVDDGYTGEVWSNVEETN